LVNNIVKNAEAGGGALVNTTSKQGDRDPELLEKVFQLIRLAEDIDKAAKQARRLRATNQSETQLELAGYVHQKQEASRSMMDLITTFFMGQRIVPVGPSRENVPEYAAYVSTLAEHHRLMRLAAVEAETEDSEHSETIRDMCYGVVRLHLPVDTVLSLVQAGALAP